MIKTRYLLFLLSLFSPAIIKSCEPSKPRLEQLQEMLCRYTAPHLNLQNPACTITHMIPVENPLCMILVARLNPSNMHNKLLLVAKLLTAHQQFDTQFGVVTIPAVPAQGITVDRVIQRDENFSLYISKLNEGRCSTGYAYSFDYTGKPVPLEKIPLTIPSRCVEEISKMG